MTTSISVEDLGKTYRLYRRPHHRLLQWIADRTRSGRSYCLEVEAARGVTFEVSQGETVVILGRNGSGKSTLLQMIAGTLTPTHGTVAIQGRVSALLELGAGFNADYTGRENMRLNARIFGLSTKEIDAAEPSIEAFADIGEFIDEAVRTYSSGMYVRLAFATAIHLIPDVLIVDEALAVGDVFFQQKCIDYILTQMQRTTKLIVTHDVSTAARMGDRVLVMDQGRLVFNGPPLEGIEAYTSLSLRSRAYASHIADRSEPDQEIALLDDNLTQSIAETVQLQPSQSSNPDVLLFDAISLSVLSGEGGNRRSSSRPTLTLGDRLEVITDITLKSSVDQPIVGYLVRDRVGNAVFGQNTIGSQVALPGGLPPGRYRLVFSFGWPELAEGEYFLTIGAGDGRHPLHHSILGWAQNVVSLVSAPARPVHGMFNSDILTAEVMRIS